MYGLWAKSSQLFFKIKFYWNAVVSIYLHTVYGYFCATTVEFNSWAQDLMACKAKLFKSLPTLALYNKLFKVGVLPVSLALISGI